MCVFDGAVGAFRGFGASLLPGGVYYDHCDCSEDFGVRRSGRRVAEHDLCGLDDGWAAIDGARGDWAVSREDLFRDERATDLSGAKDGKRSRQREEVVIY